MTLSAARAPAPRLPRAEKLVRRYVGDLEFSEDVRFQLGYQTDGHLATEQLDQFFEVSALDRRKPARATAASLDLLVPRA